MKVAELIAQLQQYPPDHEIWISETEFDGTPIKALACYTPRQCLAVHKKDGVYLIPPGEPAAWPYPTSADDFSWASLSVELRILNPQMNGKGHRGTTTPRDPGVILGKGDHIP